MLSTLQQKILEAHSRGDTRELARLQAEYRNSAVITSSDRGARTLPRTVTKPSARPPLAVVAVTPPEPARVELREIASPRFEVHLYAGRQYTSWWAQRFENLVRQRAGRPTRSRG